MSEPSKSKTGIPYPPEECHARRHMPPWVFVTYDAMLAAAKSNKNRKPGSPLVYHGRETTLANKNNRVVEQERAAIRWMVANEWLEPLPRHGQRGTKRYRIVEHEEYISRHSNCPSYRYDPETGEPLAKDEQPLNFLIRNRLNTPYQRGFATAVERYKDEILAYWQQTDPEAVAAYLSKRGGARSEDGLETGRARQRQRVSKRGGARFEDFLETGRIPSVETGRIPSKPVIRLLKSKEEPVSSIQPGDPQTPAPAVFDSNSKAAKPAGRERRTHEANQRLAGVVARALVRELKRIKTDWLKPVSLTSKEERELATLISPYTKEAIASAVQLFVARPKGFSGVHSPGGLLLKELPALLEQRKGDE